MKKTDFKIHLRWPSVVMFSMALSGYLLITFWLFWPYTPIEIHSIDITNQGGIYAGEMLYYQTNYTKTKIYPVVSVVRQLIDGSVVVLAPGPASKLPVGKRRVAVEAKIPGFVCAGTYQFHLTATYQVNPMRTVSVVAVSKPFEIKRHDEGQLQSLLESRAVEQGVKDGRVIHERAIRNNMGQYGVTDQASGE